MRSQSEEDSLLSSDDGRSQRLQAKKGYTPSSQKGILRDRPPAPFSSRQQDVNKMRRGGVVTSRPGGKRVMSDVNVTSTSQEDSSDAENASLRQEVQRQSQRAMKKMRSIETVTSNMNQMSQRKRRTNSSGILKSIKLYNFMCHKSFYQEWHENLNFVVGENGSGKSALLSGLIIGLGGRALSTSRTNSVKELIKTGETHAKTEVVLLNKGKLPVDEYGDEITVQRIIDTKGHSTYKLQFGAGTKFKPTTKIEVDNVLRLLDIQLENPVVILNQEYARSFLRSKDPKDKYKLFEDGVGTAQCDTMRAQVIETLKDIDKTIGEKYKELQSLERDYKDAEEKVELIEGISAHQETLDALNRELKWHYVQLEEVKENVAKEELEKRRAALINMKGKYEDSLERQRLAEVGTQPNAEEQNEWKRKKNELQRQREEIQKEISKLTREKVHYEMKLKTAETGIPKTGLTITRLERKLQKDEEKAQSDQDALMDKYREHKLNLKKQMDDLKDEIQRLEAEKLQFQEGHLAASRDLECAKEQHDGIRNQISIKESALRRMEGKTSNVAAFGSQMESLVDKVAANMKRFSKPPRGPLGACITVKDPKYVDIIQHVLKKHLFDFVVNCQEDAAVLNNLINQCYNRGGSRPSVHVIRFVEAYDVSRTNCSRGIPHPSMLDMLEFDKQDPVVMNTFIEISYVERVLLFKTNEEGLDLLANRETTPRSCRVGYSLDFYKITPDPNFRCDVLRADNRQKLLRSSSTQFKRLLQLELGTLKEELSNFVVDQALVEEEQRLRKEVARLDERRRKKLFECNKATQEYQSLKAPPNKMADLASIREELEEKIKEKEDMEKEVDVHREAVSEKKAALAAKEAEKKNIDAEHDKIQKELLRAMESQQAKKDEVEKLTQFANQFKVKVQRVEDEVRSHTKRVADVVERVKQLTEEALNLGERIDVTRGSAEIKKEHDQTKARIEHLSKYAEKNQNIRERYMDLKKRYKKYKTDFGIVYEMNKRVKKYFAQVSSHYLYARDNVCKALKKCYEAVAASRKYHGKIEIDHETRELFYLICPDKESLEKIEQHSKDNKYKNKMVEYAAGLSGGERSFSTICFIIAMWQAMKSPFYMLDEFDVFMDAQNRKVSQEALMTHAKEFNNNQFFFFTPLDLTNIPPSSEALILRLYPPERNANEELPSLDAEPTGSNTGTSRKRGRKDNEQAGPSKSRRV